MRLEFHFYSILLKLIHTNNLDKYEQTTKTASSDGQTTKALKRTIRTESDSARKQLSHEHWKFEVWYVWTLGRGGAVGWCNWLNICSWNFQWSVLDLDSKVTSTAGNAFGNACWPIGRVKRDVGMKDGLCVSGCGRVWKAVITKVYAAIPSSILAENQEGW